MTCQRCGIEIERQPVGRPRLYCSDLCRVTSWQQQNIDKARTHKRLSAQRRRQRETEKAS